MYNCGASPPDMIFEPKPPQPQKTGIEPRDLNHKRIEISVKRCSYSTGDTGNGAYECL